jgi:CheY-like chemotaxis protein
MTALTILVAEDDPINRRVITRMLERMGCAADVVPDGMAAVDRVRRGNYDVVLMDLMMPEMDGIEACRRIRALGQSIQQPYILAVTANVMTEDREACFQAGMDAFLAKPIQIDALRNQLRHLPAVGRADESIDEEFDPAVFRQLFHSLGSDEAFMAGLVRDFIEDAGVQIARLRSTTVAGVFEDARRAAHSLKSTAATFGATALSRSAGLVRPLAENHDAEAILELADRLDTELQSVIGILSARVAVA